MATLLGVVSLPTTVAQIDNHDEPASGSAAPSIIISPPLTHTLSPAAKSDAAPTVLTEEATLDPAPALATADAEARFRVIFVLGGPGAGKGTQCARLASSMDFKHISAGDCLREEMDKRDSANGALIKAHIENGTLVPVEITLQLMREKMHEHGPGMYLIDGFPRDRENLDKWQSVLGTEAPVVCCLFLDCPEDVMEGRLLQRGEESGRLDDNLACIKKRFAAFQKDTVPIIDWFKKQKKLVSVPSLGTADETWAVLSDKMKNVVQNVGAMLTN
ncbi:MAG: uncharacterized protein KVP18_003225 [Porospora cf. gigantea A]|nr:MAG: hypothetical protein KVP18_003225 [Porospora cf. gigantea A]